MAYIQPLLLHIFSLNKSWTKKIVVGLEYGDVSDERYKPVVRLIGNNFEGISFSLSDWKKFTTTFQDIEQYFNGDKKLEDRRYYGESWSLRFTFSHKKRAIEIVENFKADSDSGNSKRFCHSIVLHQVSFETLIRDVEKCIDSCLKKLATVARAASIVTREFINYIELESPMMYHAQITHYTAEHVKESTAKVDDAVFSNIQKIVCENINKDSDTDVILDRDSVYLIFFELSSFHASAIAEFLNNKIYKD